MQVKVFSLDNVCTASTPNNSNTLSKAESLSTVTKCSEYAIALSCMPAMVCMSCHNRRDSHSTRIPDPIKVMFIFLFIDMCESSLA